MSLCVPLCVCVCIHKRAPVHACVTPKMGQVEIIFVHLLITLHFSVCWEQQVQQKHIIKHQSCEMSPWSPFKLDIKIEIHIYIQLFSYQFYTAKHMSVSSISSERTAPCLTLSKDARNTPAPHGTSGFSHFFTPMCNRQRQAVSDGINSESEYSGGQ